MRKSIVRKVWLSLRKCYWMLLKQMKCPKFSLFYSEVKILSILKTINKTVLN
jgi:hypothetical protein